MIMKKTVAFNSDAFDVFKSFYGHKGLFFLDSSQKSSDGRYSYLGFSPFKVLTGNNLDSLRKEFKHLRGAIRHGRFSSGAVGHIDYDGRYCFGFYDQVLEFDHTARCVTINAPGAKNIKAIESVLNNLPAVVTRKKPLNAVFKLKSDFSKSSYIAAIKKALGHIRRGDIYQINLSRRIEASFKDGQAPDPLELYTALRLLSPSPFAAYYEGDRETILSSSPERFLKMTERLVQVRPMKGTRPRGFSQKEDKRIKQDLLHDPKEIAELLMVTDLERNDLGRVCNFGSIKVKAMRQIEEYKTVFQATATIEGQLRKDCDAFDLLKAAFPSGSVTGCPKIEAMRVIESLEKSKRGAYTGALGYIDFNGDIDFSVLIRSLFVTPQQVVFHVGGGIVADSVPESEYDETCVKAKAMQEAIGAVCRG